MPKEESYTEMTFSFHGISYIYKIFESGRVVDMSGSEICATGG